MPCKSHPQYALLEETLIFSFHCKSGIRSDLIVKQISNRVQYYKMDYPYAIPDSSMLQRHPRVLISSVCVLGTVVTLKRHKVAQQID
jgi:hypothetical protein